MSVSVFRSPGAPFHSFVCKPRFLLDGSGDLVLLPMPFRQAGDLRALLADPESIRTLGAHDFWYEPFVYENWLFEHSRACRLLYAGWARLRQRYIDGDRPLSGPPGRGVFNRYSSGFKILMRLLEQCIRDVQAQGALPIVLLLPDGYSVNRLLRGLPGIMDPLRDACQDQGLELVDLAVPLLDRARAEGAAALFIERFHYSERGNQVVAEHLLQEAHSRGWRQLLSRAGRAE